MLSQRPVYMLQHRNALARASLQMERSTSRHLTPLPVRPCGLHSALTAFVRKHAHVSGGGADLGNKTLGGVQPCGLKASLGLHRCTIHAPESPVLCVARLVERCKHLVERCKHAHLHAHARHPRPQYLLAGTDGVEWVQHRLPRIQVGAPRQNTQARTRACTRVCECQHLCVRRFGAESGGWETWAQRRAKAPPHIFSAPLRCFFHSPPLKEHWGACPVQEFQRPKDSRAACLPARACPRLFGCHPLKHAPRKAWAWVWAWASRAPAARRRARGMPLRHMRRGRGGGGVREARALMYVQQSARALVSATALLHPTESARHIPGAGALWKGWTAHI